jgi:hypothetical protein
MDLIASIEKPKIFFQSSEISPNKIFLQKIGFKFKISDCEV